MKSIMITLGGQIPNLFLIEQSLRGVDFHFFFFTFAP